MRELPWKHLAVPFALIVLIVLIAIPMPAAIHLGPLLVVAPALTASFAGPGITAGMGILAVAAQIFLRMVRGGLTPAENLIQVSTVLIVTGIVTLYAAARNRHLRTMAQVRLVSEAAQQIALRPLPRRIGSLQISSMYIAAAAEALIGGDLYAAARVNGRTRLIIGDVSGKGLPTIGDAATLLHAFREAAHEDKSLPELVTRLETNAGHSLPEPDEKNGTPRNVGENFVTAAILQIPDDRLQVELVACGHPPPLLLHGQDVTALRLCCAAPPLGLAELAEPGYEVETFPFEPDDTLLLYTDGVIEARNAAGEFYPLAERVRQWPGLEPDALISRVREDLLAFAGGRLDDDAALVVVKRIRLE